jgi:Raf kinase inhibitor-like YbhB/YbcL family protein
VQLTSQSIADGKPIPETYAMGIPGSDGPKPGPNKSPQLAWSGAPSGTRSFALLTIDVDAPTKADDVNKPDRTVPFDLARAEFVHWVLVDIPGDKTELAEGADANGFTPRGKPLGKTPNGVRGLNDYTSWFAGDDALRGKYAGYDGPWPPFNDERRHHYHFTLYALDVPTLGLSGEFGAKEVRKAIEGHVLAQASIQGSYAIYPKAR